MCLFFKKHKSNNIEISYSDIPSLLGGHDNIVSYLSSGSRVSIECKDISLVKKDELKHCGVDNVLVMSHKAILVTKHPKDIIKAINNGR